MAYDNKVILMIDAEESWMQDAVDHLVNEMMEKYNKEKAYIWNTLQMYRTGRLEYMAQDLERAKSKNYFLGYKFVRGAYMEKEAKRAEEKGYKNPICSSKQATDDNFNAAVSYMMEHIESMAIFAGTHNEDSSYLVMKLMIEKGLSKDDKRVWFGQLCGIS